MQRSLSLTLGLLALACRPARPPEAPAPSPAPAPAPAPVRRLADFYEVPSADAPWTAREYLQLRDVLVSVELERPELLPRRDGPDAALLARATDLAAITETTRATRRSDQRHDLHLAVAEILTIYSARALTGGDFGREYIDFAVVFFRESALQIEEPAIGSLGVVEELRVSKLRRHGFVQLRYHLARGVRDVAASSLALPAVVDPLRCASAIASVADDIAPWFLPEERDLMLGLIDRMADAGAAGRDLSTLRTAFAPAREAHPLVDAFIEEHRAYLERQDELKAAVAAGQLSAVELRREADGARWAFPDAGFSGVFPRRPGAQLQRHTATDDTPLVRRTLGFKDGVGITRSITCNTRQTPLTGTSVQAQLAGFAAKLGLTGARDVTIAGAAVAVEGRVVNESAEALMRLVGVDDRTTCVITFEYPKRLAHQVADLARRFVASFELGDFRG
jgi:hypothetical protein